MAPVDNEYLSAFKRYNPIVISSGFSWPPNQNTIDDFKFLASFNKMILSNSTFAWWAAFFGSPQAVYTFRPWIGPSNVIRLSDFPNSTSSDGRFLGKL